MFSMIPSKPASEKGGVGDPPDLDPQDRAVWPVGQVHMLGLEQKPSPHELRQIAAKETRHEKEGGSRASADFMAPGLRENSCLLLVKPVC